MIDLIALFFPTALMICFAGTISVVAKRKVGVCIPVAYLISGFVLYFTQFIFHTFNIGIFLISLCAIAFIPLAIIRKEKIKNDFLTYGLVVYVAAFIIYCFVDFKRCFAAWDEMSHWGVMVKEMLRLDTWYMVDGSRFVAHKEYPPFVSLLEFLWCKLSGGMTETGCYMALHSFSIALLIPPVVDSCCDKKVKIRIKEIAGIFCLIISVLLFMEFFDDYQEFMSIYKDLILSFIFVYIMLQLIIGKRDVFCKFSVTLATASLMITKQMGIAFVLLICAYILFERLFQKNCKEPLWKFGIQYVGFIIVVLIPYSMWSSLVKYYNLAGQFDFNRISFETLRNILFDSEAISVQRKVLNVFVSAIFTKEITTSYFPISYFILTCVVIVLVVMILKFSDYISSERRLSLLITFICGSIGYISVVGVLYLFCFNEYEAINLASYGRYVSAYVMAEMLILAGIAGVSCYKKVDLGLKKIALFTVGLALCTNITNLRIFCPGILKTALKGNAHQEYIDIANYLESKTEGYAKVYILAKDSVKSQFYVNYYSYDLDYTIDNTDYYENVVTDDMLENVLKKIDESDYLFIKDDNGTIASNLEKKFNIKDIQAGVIYRIINGKLEKIG